MRKHKKSWTRIVMSTECLLDLMLVGIEKELRGGCLQGVAYSPNFVQTHGLLPTLNPAHVGAVDIGKFCKVLLGDVLRLSGVADCIAECHAAMFYDALSVHAVYSPPLHGEYPRLIKRI